MSLAANYHGINTDFMVNVLYSHPNCKRKIGQWSTFSLYTLYGGLVKTSVMHSEESSAENSTSAIINLVYNVLLHHTPFLTQTLAVFIRIVIELDLSHRTHM